MKLFAALSERRLAPWAAAGLVAVAAVALTAAAPQSKKKAGPETFNARATVGSSGGRGDSYVTIRIEQYTPESNVKTMTRALQDGGSAAFLVELRRAPVAGRFEVGGQTFTIRWARQRDTDLGRVISLVIDKPVYFVGGGVPGAKSREGFDV